MKKFSFCAGALAVLLGLCVSPAVAQTATEAPADDAVVAEEMPVYTIPNELNDPAFNQYVDITLLGPAWSAKDAAALTDIALQLAEGERILLRSHKAGSSKDLLNLATKIAQSSDDKAALGRIEQAATHLKYDDVVASTKSSNKLAGASRRDEPAMKVDLNQTSLQGIATYSYLLDQLRNAELLSDKSALESFDSVIDTTSGLTEAQKEFLKRRSGEIKALPDDPATNQNRIIATIAKLEGDSRHGGHGGHGGGGGGFYMNIGSGPGQLQIGIGGPGSGMGRPPYPPRQPWPPYPPRQPWPQYPGVGYPPRPPYPGGGYPPRQHQHQHHWHR
ncbi:hypothetical protein [Planctomicrobium sp. SH527]|uniref:hypothetical protein n=1 Tax=Planctomicrobium sp. SH527 TaxID=3448123 RepID=UPI003F5C2E6E